MDWAVFKAWIWSLISFFFYFREWCKGKTNRQRCVCVCAWLTCYSWCCFGLILTPTPAPLRFLLRSVPLTHIGNVCILCFSFSVSVFICASVLFTFFPSFLTRLVLLSLWLWHALTQPLHIDCQADWVMFYIPHRGAPHGLNPIPFGGYMTGAAGCTQRSVYVCSLYYKWFAHLKIIFANKDFRTNSSRENYLFVNFVSTDWKKTKSNFNLLFKFQLASVGEMILYTSMYSNFS